MWTRSNLKESAKAAFRNNYWICVLVSLVISFLLGTGASVGSSGATQSSSPTGREIALATLLMLAGFALTVCVVNPLRVGGTRFFVVNDSEKAEFSELGHAFSHNYGKVISTMLLKDVFLTLWAFLLIVPAIIKSYSYRMVPYILAEDPDLGATEVIKKSQEMMKGNKWDAFLLDLSFLGWTLLGILTLGIVLIFWVSPYKNQTDAELYLAIKDNVEGVNIADDYNSSYYNVDSQESFEPIQPLD